MDPVKWQNIKNVMSAVLDLPAGERADFLARETESEIRTAVEKLLAAHEEAGAFIDKPLLIEQGLAEDDTQDSLIGARIENYTILERIGAGGMGAVYLAKRVNSDFTQKVALKLIKRGMDSEAILKRFAVERRILSQLKHSNIAQLIDGGIASEGIPFFVMEFVDGKPLNEFCRENYLSLEERLKIFGQICAAVDYAHRNLVVHRDLKPSNILVSEDGVPKLLDFGIARLLSDENEETTAAQAKMFTPEYASPEQILGKTVTTATDVYSLGVILYELLSGHRPFETKGKSYQEIIKSVCDTEPTRPSAWISDLNTKAKFKRGETQAQNGETNPHSQIPDLRLLKGDLDNIILKALRKEPSERYGSVRQLAEDISRFLGGLPVLARPQTLKYRFGKYVRRHRIGVFAAALVLLSLVGGISVATWQAIEARRERARAEKRFAETRKIANSLLFEIHDSLSDLPGATASRELLVKRALEYLNNLSLEADNNPELMLELSIAYRKIGDIQGDPYQANMGKTSDAADSYQKSLEMQEKLLSKAPEDVNLHKEILMTASHLGDIFFSQGKFSESEDAFQRAIRSAIFVAENEPQNTTVNNNLAFLYRRLSWILGDSENVSEKPDYFELARKYSEQALASNPEDEDTLSNAVEIYGNIGNRLGNPDYNDLGKPAEALVYLQKSLSLRQKLADRNPDSNQHQNSLGIGFKDLGDVFLAQGKIKEANEYYEKALAIHRKLAEKDGKNALAKAIVAYDLNKLGIALLKKGEIDNSFLKHKDSLETLEKIYLSDKANILVAHTLVLSLEGLGDALAARKEYTESLTYYNRGLNLEEELLEEELNVKQPDLEYQRKIAQLYFKIGKTKKLLATSQKNNQLLCQESIAAFQKAAGMFNQIKMKSFLSQTNLNILRQAQNESENTACRK